jgi:hypothetical protein
VLAAEGIVQAETYLQVGETIRPVRLDGDRRGYVIAVADTSVEALERAERAARLLEVDVEGRGRSLPETWEEFRRLPFPDDSGEEVVQELAEYDGYAAGLVSQVVSGAEPSLPLEIDEALTLRIEATGSTELIDYVRRLNELILAARGEESRQA